MPIQRLNRFQKRKSPVQRLTPESEAKMSAVILQIARPLITRHASSMKQVETLITLTIVGWNRAVFLSAGKLDAGEPLLEECLPEEQDSEVMNLFHEVMDFVSDQQEARYSDLRRVIVDHSVEVNGDELTVNVSSASLQD